MTLCAQVSAVSSLWLPRSYGNDATFAAGVWLLSSQHMRTLTQTLVSLVNHTVLSVSYLQPTHLKPKVKKVVTH